MKQCPKCHEMNGDSAERCPKCGYVFEKTKPMITSLAMKIIAWVALDILLFAGIIIGVMGTPVIPDDFYGYSSRITNEYNWHVYLLGQCDDRLAVVRRCVQHTLSA